jgi:hypothetical protein
VTGRAGRAGPAAARQPAPSTAPDRLPANPAALAPRHRPAALDLPASRSRKAPHRSRPHRRRRIRECLRQVCRTATLMAPMLMLQSGLFCTNQPRSAECSRDAPNGGSACVSPDSGITERDDIGCRLGVTWLAGESPSGEVHADTAKRAAGRVERAEIRLDDHLQRSARNGQARPRRSLIHPGTPASITVYRRPLSRRIDVVGRSHAVIPNPEKRKVGGSTPPLTANNL